MHSASTIAAIIAVIAAIALIVGALFYVERRPHVELGELPAVERRALYDRTLDTLRSTCVQEKGPTLGELCREQAELIVHFDECDRECRELARRFAPQPTR